MKYKFLLCIGFCLVTTSCCRLLFGERAPNYKEEWITGKYKEGANNHIDKLLNVDGFYAPCNDDALGPLALYYIFYNDGSFIDIYLDGNTLFLRNKEHVDVGANAMHSSKKPYLYSGGYYALRGDTIVMDIYYVYGGDWFVNLKKEYFKIIDRNHIKRIGTQFFTLSKGPSKIGKEYTVLYEFVPTSTLPSADCVGTKNDKNMWYDENEWLNWKKKTGR